MSTSLQKVYATKDDSGHWYVIPAEMADDFYALLEKGDEVEYKAFEEKYGNYKTGGGLNNIQLYAEI